MKKTKIDDYEISANILRQNTMFPVRLAYLTKHWFLVGQRGQRARSTTTYVLKWLVLVEPAHEEFALLRRRIFIPEMVLLRPYVAQRLTVRLTVTRLFVVTT